ncbi:MAG: transcriptional regulator NrdR [Candidatus Nanohaloarchaeota archaeon QJJ-9]|nr:transcriptional regulator NrdR [Candidatus Nanohaloarchaeota archaeon QJJ-9]
MRCPYCSTNDTRVVDTRLTSNNRVRRRRECNTCEERFTTYEQVSSPDIEVMKKDGSIESFKREKLREGIEKAFEKKSIGEEELEKLVDGVEKEIIDLGKDKVSSEEIGRLVMEKLKEKDEVAYLRFASVYQSFDNLESFQEELKQLSDI